MGLLWIDIEYFTKYPYKYRKEQIRLRVVGTTQHEACVALNLR